LDSNARESDRIAATRELLDRGWGKAVEFVDIEGANTLDHDEIAAEIRSIAEALKRERTRVTLDAPSTTPSELISCPGANGSFRKPGRMSLDRARPSP
jgi:hypothetical protein